MSKSGIIKRLLLLLFSVAGGALITIGVFILMMLTDHGDSTKSLEERHPFAWVLIWPERLLSVESLEVVVIGNILLYATLIYLLFHWSSKSVKLP